MDGINHLKSIYIQNFQSHKSTKIMLDKGVNAIVGPSNSGKSAIIRALKWLIYNQPSGEAFRSNWGGDTEVIATFQDGIVGRVRNKEFNGYILNEEKYKGFGRGVPEPVIKFLNMTDLNFQSQLDPPFMLSWSPGERGSFINKLINLSVIDKTIQKNKKLITQDQNRITNLYLDIKELEEQKKEYDGLKELEKRTNELIQIETRIDVLYWRIDHIEKLVKDAGMLKDRIKEYEGVLQAQYGVKKVEALLSRVQSIEDAILALDDYLYDIEKCQEEIDRYHRTLTSLNKKFNTQFPDVCPLCGRASNE
jgi:exonuclease SbcC